MNVHYIITTSSPNCVKHHSFKFGAPKNLPNRHLILLSYFPAVNLKLICQFLGPDVSDKMHSPNNHSTLMDYHNRICTLTQTVEPFTNI